VVWRRRWDLLSPIVLILTALITHLHHQPYWYYYCLHFEIGLAWLAGIGIECARAEFGATGLTNRCEGGVPLPPSIVWLLLISVITMGWFEGMDRSTKWATSARSVSKVPLTVALTTNRVEARWVFTDRPAYVFQAGMAVPPELAVLSKKRFWTGQINSAAIVDVLRRYLPEIILLAGPLRQDFQYTEGGVTHRTVISRDAFGRYLKEGYSEIFSDSSGSLYARNDLVKSNSATSLSQKVAINELMMPAAVK